MLYEVITFLNLLFYNKKIGGINMFAAISFLFFTALVAVLSYFMTRDRITSYNVCYTKLLRSYWKSNLSLDRFFFRSISQAFLGWSCPASFLLRIPLLLSIPPEPQSGRHLTALLFCQGHPNGEAQSLLYWCCFVITSYSIHYTKLYDF